METLTLTPRLGGGTEQSECPGWGGRERLQLPLWMSMHEDYVALGHSFQIRCPSSVQHRFHG